MFLFSNEKREKQVKSNNQTMYTEFNAQFMYLSVHNFSSGYFNMANMMFVFNILECKILWLLETWCVFVMK